ncbi:hypothetical protein GQ37_013945 [Janthinobacterium sp. BJB1]|uniref:DUF5908 family protein n=1 Tax=Janthinobacterium sp. GW458P TaxID=1981504 RepID=UPI000A32A1F2|nr:DUF5908 family protein [Janthinobacterium sp. GW458P]MBE3024388.1 hypothetical protein [Janthinobacterium sp. GW458P]PHV15164.1 hypothetical protein CSQ90_19250 [Janthinobacterium sp. BJB303]PJC98157.1 hypothetical protein GQ37_013945 [Janthinobacterium sp. BJB1]
MPIDIQQLHIKSSVVQRAAEDAPQGAAQAIPGNSCCEESSAATQREQILADCKRLIRAAISQLQER